LSHPGILVLPYITKHQIYVPVCCCTIHEEITEICPSIQLYSTRQNIRNMYPYIVVQYTMKHQKYVPVCSCTVHCDTSKICVSILLYCTQRHIIYILTTVLKSNHNTQVKRTCIFWQNYLEIYRCISVLFFCFCKGVNSWHNHQYYL
jgi:hypothetical protein